MQYHPVSIALGAGGLKGAAHLGILRVFEEEGFPIQYISGSSSGALIGAMYAYGYSTEELLAITEDYVENPPLDFRIRPLVAFGIFIKSVLNWLKVSNSATEKGLIDGKQMDRYLQKLFVDTGFEDLQYPLLVAATDLRTGRLQVFTTRELGREMAGVHDIDIYTDVNLATALRASTAIPGIFPPACYDQKMLVDGGVKDKVPADLLRFAGGEKIVAIDVGVSTETGEEYNTMLEILLQTVDIMGDEMTDLITERYADLVIKPPLGDIALTDTHRIQEIYQIGYKTGKRKTRAIQALLQKN